MPFALRETAGKSLELTVVNTQKNKKAPPLRLGEVDSSKAKKTEGYDKGALPCSRVFKGKLKFKPKTNLYVTSSGFSRHEKICIEKRTGSLISLEASVSQRFSMPFALRGTAGKSTDSDRPCWTPQKNCPLGQGQVPWPYQSFSPNSFSPKGLNVARSYLVCSQFRGSPGKA